MYQVLCLDHLAYCLQQACKVHVIVSILHPRKGRLRDQGAGLSSQPNKWQCQGWVPPESLFIYYFTSSVMHRKENQGSWALGREA